MRKVSAKIRLTLFTTFLMLLMASVLIAFMFLLADDIVMTNSMTQLMEVVDDNSKEMEFDDGELDLDDVDFFKEGVYTLLYSQNGEYIYGEFPEDIVTTQPFQDKETSEFTFDGTLYYIYDRLSPVEDSRSLIWVRGILAVDEVVSTTNTILQIALFALPLFVLLGAIGCYFIAKHTFRPIDKIIKTAEEISKSDNLALRINLQSGSPEMHKLSDTFNTLFKHLESTFEAEKQFTSDVSHELRTPTAVILAQCEYALGDNIPPEDKEDALETVQRQAYKMSQLISDLLNLIRLDRGVEKPELSYINLSKLVSDVCKEQSLLAPHDIKLTYTIEPNIQGIFNQEMIARLLTNLISNAFTYRNINGHVEIVLIETNTEIILSIKDDGIGIAKEHQDKIWHRFYQVDSSRTAGQNGSMGLGLSMVAQIAKLHHAKIELKSEINKGSLFIVKFPK